MTFISHAHTSGKQTGAIKMALWLMSHGRQVEAEAGLREVLAEVEAEDAARKVDIDQWLGKFTETVTPAKDEVLYALAGSLLTPPVNPIHEEEMQ